MISELVFIQNNNLAISVVRMGCSNLCCKILSELTREEFQRWLPDFSAREDTTSSDPEFIQNVWNMCIMRGYIPEEYEVMSKHIDKIKIIV